METPAKTVYRFGPFEADTSSGELVKLGKRIRLQEQPFRLLIILIEHAGEVVSKAEIQKRIWDGNTYVDFDSSLRVAVGKLREALGDDAGSPHYIESIPKRGYRFLGQVALTVDPLDQESVAQPHKRSACLQAEQRNHPDGFSLAGWCCSSQASLAHTSSSRNRRRCSPNGTWSCLPTLITRPGTRFSMTRCAKAWQCSWNNRLS